MDAINKDVTELLLNILVLIQLTPGQLQMEKNKESEEWGPLCFFLLIY